MADPDLIHIEQGEGAYATIVLPEAWSTDTSWKPERLPPIEVIDGQHRLLAFEETDDPIDMELPVVAFDGLDISWQAYLFWIINITPKRINPSLAFDLYPLLRTESWLEAVEGHSIYREARSQELVEALWSHPASVWHHRIDMLGESGRREVSQASWVRSLAASYIKAWESTRVPIGGLFGAPLDANQDVLPWSRAQQAAFLILVWQLLGESIASTEDDWANSLRGKSGPVNRSAEKDPAFAGAHTLLNTDQGVRAVLQVTNDLCYIRAKDLQLDRWQFGNIDVGAGQRSIDESTISLALDSLQEQPVREYLSTTATLLANFDWRSASAESLSEAERSVKLGFRGSGGYRELRRQVLIHLGSSSGDVANAATEVHAALGY